MKFHVLLTTYEMAVAEGTALRSLQYEALIVDEGHRYCQAPPLCVCAQGQGWLHTCCHNGCSQSAKLIDVTA